MKFITAFEKSAQDLGSSIGAAIARRRGAAPGAPPPPPPTPPPTTSAMGQAFGGIRKAFGGV